MLFEALADYVLNTKRFHMLLEQQALQFFKFQFFKNIKISEFG